MLGVGQKFPAFSVQATVSLEQGKAFQTIDEESYKDKWKVYFFWPKDFTFVCPTEIAAFGKLNGQFQDRDAQLLGLMRLELDADLIAKLRSVTYYGGLPLDARTVTEDVAGQEGK